MNSLLATGHFSLLLLVAGLFVPRLTLFVAWFFSSYPPNTLSDLVNFLGWLFLPRFLIAFYIYADMGTNNIWFWAFIITGLFGLFGESGAVRRRVVRRRRVIRDGNTVTTVEEEV